MWSVVLFRNFVVLQEQEEREQTKRQESGKKGVKEAAQVPVQPESEKINRGEKKRPVVTLSNSIPPKRSRPPLSDSLSPWGDCATGARCRTFPFGKDRRLPRVQSPQDGPRGRVDGFSHLERRRRESSAEFGDEDECVTCMGGEQTRRWHICCKKVGEAAKTGACTDLNRALFAVADILLGWCQKVTLGEKRVVKGVAVVRWETSVWAAVHLAWIRENSATETGKGPKKNFRSVARIAVEVNYTRKYADHQVLQREMKEICLQI